MVWRDLSEAQGISFGRSRPTNKSNARLPAILFRFSVRRISCACNPGLGSGVFYQDSEFVASTSDQSPPDRAELLVTVAQSPNLGFVIALLAQPNCFA